MQVDEEMDLLFAWSLTETSVYQLQDGKHHFTFENVLNAQEDVITDLLYMPKYRYIVMSTQKGRLVVYKWASTAQVITEFKGMDKAIKSLSRH